MNMRGQDTDWRVPRDELGVEYPPTCLWRKRINWEEAGPHVPRCVQFSRIITMANTWKCLVSHRFSRKSIVLKTMWSRNPRAQRQSSQGLSETQAWVGLGCMLPAPEPENLQDIYIMESHRGWHHQASSSCWSGGGLTTIMHLLSTKPTDITGGWTSFLRHPLKKHIFWLLELRNDLTLFTFHVPNNAS